MLGPWGVFAIFVAFMAKHYLADYPLQKNPWLWGNKHIWWHPGGWVHAGVHGVLSAAVLLCAKLFVHLNSTVVLLVIFLEVIAHHEIDAWKMNKNKMRGWKPDTHPEFWVLLGQDQLFHGLTNAAMIAALMVSR